MRLRLGRFLEEEVELHPVIVACIYFNGGALLCCRYSPHAYYYSDIIPNTVYTFTVSIIIPSPVLIHANTCICFALNFV